MDGSELSNTLLSLFVIDCWDVIAFKCSLQLSVSAHDGHHLVLLYSIFTSWYCMLPLLVVSHIAVCCSGESILVLSCCL